MMTWTTQIALHVLLLTGTTPTYEQALKLAQKQDKPLLVFVGADWCPGCQTMKNDQLPMIVREGIFKNLVFTMVNTDQQPELSRRLLSVSSIPQLILFVKGGTGWHRSELIGVHNADSVRHFLAEETAAAHGESHVAPASEKTSHAAVGQATAKR